MKKNLEEINGKVSFDSEANDIKKLIMYLGSGLLVALLYHGVGMEVMGDNWNQYSDELRKRIATKFPRGNFKYDVIQVFYDGFKHKPETTFGNVKSDVLS